MALTKVVTYDYEVRTEYKHIQERQRTAIVEDGSELSYSYHRRVLTPDADVSSESDEIIAMIVARDDYENRAERSSE